jgi:hypothetical protein
VPTSSLIRQDLVPMVTGYLVLMAVLGIGLRHLQRSPASRARAANQAHPEWRALFRYMIGTAVGGYLLLSAVVVAYYFGVARVDGQFLQSAFTGPALLVGITLPVFAAASWLMAWGRRRRRAHTTGRGRARRE